MNQRFLNIRSMRLPRMYQPNIADPQEHPSLQWRSMGGAERPCPRAAYEKGRWRKHIFGDGCKDVQLSYEDDLKRTMFSSINRVTAEIRERFQLLQNLAQKYAFLRPEVMLSSLT
ncbi:uncharacterized protein TNCV_4697421 [Trichonephila clavipes]|nr:uncharacterized protein TNCV_4697421 [Trichonephila clavipes]